MITKKMVVGLKRSDSFLIPNWESGNGYVSIKNGKKLDEGMIVYTGVGLTGEMVMEKIKEEGSLNSIVTKISAEQLDDYLIHIKDLKMGKTYSLEITNSSFEFTLMNT